MSATDVQLPPPLIPRRRPRPPSPEIIDVDSLPDEDLPRPRPAQRRRIAPERHPVVITISDSDDDDVILVGDPQPGPSRGRRDIHAPYRIFSPSPPPTDNRVPPVPRIPAHLAAHTSFPMRRHPPPDHTHVPIMREPPFAGVIRPSTQPFEFEQQRAFRINATPEPPAHPPMAAPPSHHLPVMGLGGAIISDFARTVPAQRRPQQPAAPRRRSILYDITRFIAAPFHWGSLREGDRDMAPANREQERDDYLNALALSAALHEGPPFERRSLLDSVLRIQRGGGEQEKYRPEWTHPEKPSPGFTYDFEAPQDSAIDVDADAPGPSTSVAVTPTEGKVSLVCAKCLQPFIIGGPDESRRKNRIWGLRCGHMIDGTCMEDISQPLEPKPDPSAEDDTNGSKGKGKGKVLAALEERPDKGKGKARAQLEDPPSRGYSLRSHHRASTLVPSAVVAAPSAPAVATSSRAGGRRKAKGKGKGKQREPVPTAYHEWYCPVPGCLKEHKSALIEGKWVPAKDEGAIAVYV